MVYIANGVIIYHLPPIKGIRNSYWYTCPYRVCFTCDYKIYKWYHPFIDVYIYSYHYQFCQIALYSIFMFIYRYVYIVWIIKNSIYNFKHHSRNPQQKETSIFKAFEAPNTGRPKTTENSVCQSTKARSTFRLSEIAARWAPETIVITWSYFTPKQWNDIWYICVNWG